MANDYLASIRNAAASVAKYIEDAASMEVVTKYVEIGDSASSDFNQAKPVARTIVKLDADSETIFPMRKNKDGVLEVDLGLFDLHQAKNKPKPTLPIIVSGRNSTNGRSIHGRLKMRSQDPQYLPPAGVSHSPALSSVRISLPAARRTE